jgi:uncharacterized protein (TIGR03086 family)
MTFLDLYQRASHSFVERAKQVGPRDWDRPTPCAEWSVRDLVNHLVYEDRWVPPLLAGRTLAEVGDRFDGDLLGTDPFDAVADAANRAEAAFADPGALDRTVGLSFGPTPALEYGWQMLAEHLVHGWDLAVALGADGELDADTVRECAAWFADREELFRHAGAIGPRVEPTGDASEQDRLLGATGRDPHWSPPAR